jgi:hypothetical protein
MAIYVLGEHFTDLDELVLRCRDKEARAYIAEAVACYRAGAFRACIVTTWIAVVFDFIHKLKELELTGDKLAQQKLQMLEKIQSQNDIGASLVFEREVLDLAKNNFEFLSTVEYDDLKRLFEDRNRCAHPSMQTWDEPYQPAGELARYHLRNVVLYLLQRPPVQGKAALDRITKEIESEYFPVDVNQAVEHFKHGPLTRARVPLIRGVILVLTKTLLHEALPAQSRTRHVSALKAILHMYVDIGEKVLQEDLPKVLQSVNDTEWINVMKYVRCIPSSWDVLGEPGRIKALTFMTSSSTETVAPALGDALHVPALREIAIQRIQDLPVEILAEQIHSEPLQEYADLAIRFFAKARSYDQGNNLARSLIRPLAAVLAPQDIRQAVEVFLDNNQLHGSSGTIDVIGEVFEQNRQYFEELKDIWIQVYKRLKSWRRGGMRTRRGGLYEGHPLLNMIEETFPQEVGSLSETEDDDLLK